MEVDPGYQCDLGTSQTSSSIKTDTKNLSDFQTLSIISTERRDSKRTWKALMTFSLKATQISTQHQYLD